MARSPEFILEYLKQVEELANDVLLDKSELTNLSKRRDKLRESQRALRKLDHSNDEVLLLSGNLFLGLNKQQAEKVLEKDQNNLDENINTLNKRLKESVNKLYEAENKPGPKGFDLIPISKEEKQSLYDLVGK